MQGFLESLGMLAEGCGASYEDIVALITEHQAPASPDADDPLSKSKSMKPSSVVAQAWRPKPRSSKNAGAKTPRGLRYKHCCVIGPAVRMDE